MTLVHKRSLGLNCLFPSGDTPEDLGLIAVQWQNYISSVQDGK